MILPCPRCGSSATLSALRNKRIEVKRRLKEQARKRYKVPPQHGPHTGVAHNLSIKPNGLHSHSISSGGGARIMPKQIANMTENSISLGSLVGATDLAIGSCVISAPDPADIDGTVKINDAVLDVCVDCGTFYAPNAKDLADQITDEIVKLDPLGALAEVYEEVEVVCEDHRV